MDFDVEVRSLSQDFYQAYPNSIYPEILSKGCRPYSCLLIDTHGDYLICVPFRSKMNHNQGFHFTGTNRSKQSRSGLDYKKVVLVKDISYIETSAAVVDSDEYSAMMKNIQSIVSDVMAYIENYIHHVDGSKPMHKKGFKRNYEFSTLPYFHDILGLDK